MSRAYGIRSSSALPLIVTLALLGVAGAARASEGEARVEPAIAGVGETVRLVLAVRDSTPADVWVLPEIACDVTTPGGRVDAPCASALGVAHVRVLSDAAREYVFPYDGTREAGSYEVAFTLVSALTVPLGTLRAEASFAVAPEGLESAGGIEEAVDEDAPRWLATLTGAAAAGSVAIASAFTPRRGSP